MTDELSYYRYTGPQRLEKAIHTLEGMLAGFAADSVISREELQILRGWLDSHAEFAGRHPFNEIIPALNEALHDGALSHEEHTDLMWLCQKFTCNNKYFDAITAEMQRLHGLMAGISFDGKITKRELEGLQEWLNEHADLRTCWPYDELESLIATVLADGVIDVHEHAALMAFFAEFATQTGHRSVKLPDDDSFSTVKGVCALSPEIEFVDRLFCFTGRSERLPRKQLQLLVEERGGKFSSSLVKSVDYLVIGADGNPCWAYSCYGRKVEEAIKHRKEGSSILLVHEYDFWDSVS